jgi:hypothetical protein
MLLLELYIPSTPVPVFSRLTEIPIPVPAFAGQAAAPMTNAKFDEHENMTIRKGE